MSPQMVEMSDRQRQRTSERRWQDLDLAMRSISVAMACCQHAGLPRIAERMLELQRDVQQERDRA